MLRVIENIQGSVQMFKQLKLSVIVAGVVLISISGCITRPDPTPECEGCCAAGICAVFPGDIVALSINLDVPDPRCANVKGHQHLKVINTTDETQRITIGDKSFNIEPGGEHLIDEELSTFLQPCCNFLQADPGMGGHCVVLR